MNPREDRELRIAYLLGRMPEEERDAVADRLFSDPSFAELMEESERDLLDQYARGELSVEDRAAVELRLLESDRQREKLRFASVMAGRRVNLVRKPSALRVWGAIAAAVVIAAGTWALWPRHTPASQPSPQARSREAAPAQSKSPAIFAALLSPGGTRDGRRQQVRLPSATGQLRFDLELHDAKPAPAYSVQLVQAGQVLWQQAEVVPSQEAGQPILTLRIPAPTFKAGSYEFVVQSQQRQTFYRFLVL